MDRQRSGKAISTSTPSFAIRYNAEDDEAELCDVHPKIADAHSESLQTTPVCEKKDRDSLLSKTTKRSGSLEETKPSPGGGGDKEPWRFFTEIGKITKKVEEKIEEMKNDKMKKSKKPTLSNDKSSTSDNEEKSEETLPSNKINDSSPDKLTYENEESEYGDISGSEVSEIEKPPTPSFTDDIVIFPSRHRKSILETIPPSTPSTSSRIHEHKPLREKIKHKFTRQKHHNQSIEMGIDAVQDEICLPPARTSAILDLKKKKKILSCKKTFSFLAGGVLCSVLLGAFSNNSFMNGVITGTFLSLLIVVWFDNLFLTLFVDDPKFSYLKGAYKFENIPFISERSLDYLKIPAEKTYQGWMNIYCLEYNPETYHITKTESVHVTLVGSILRLATPKGQIPKRAVWDEPKHKLKFTQERVFDITNCTVNLLPEGLIRKRMWSRKYPISISLLPQSLIATNLLYGAKQSDLKSTWKQQDSGSNIPENTDTFSLSSVSTTTSTTEQSKRDPTPKVRLEDGIDEDDDDDNDNDEEEIDAGDFVQIGLEPSNGNSLILFARTAREKDIWFRRFLAATCDDSNKFEDCEEEHTKVDQDHIENKQKRLKLSENYLHFMKSIGQLRCLYEDEHGIVNFDRTHMKETFSWLNVFIARVLYDTMKEPVWINLIKDKIQRKLSVIKLPAFMEPLVLSHIEFTGSVPTIESVHSSNVKINDDGIWAEVEVSYQGITVMSVETKINLIKLKYLSKKIPVMTNTKAACYDSSQEDSGETSNEEAPTGPSGTKVPTMFDKIVSSNIFQHVTDTKLVKKAMEGVSNTTVSLHVDVKSLIGTLVINIPPPPSDRLWFGFKPDTRIHLKAKPMFGDLGINRIYISNLIEKKLYREFQKLLVIPNMDDLMLPIMTSENPF